MKTPTILHIVPHTHWDREWYRTFPAFRVQLVSVVREVLERLEAGEDLEHFLLDGQAVILEDYLEVHPEDEERIRRLVTAGQLIVGPWYVLPDLFLVSGEELVRNLQIGHRVAGRFGPVQQVGYMPDSFGHIAQMPQILSRAGIDTFVYTRGVGEEIGETGYEFTWVAPDGSEVLAVNLCGGYCAGGALGYRTDSEALTVRRPDLALAVEQVRALFERIAERSNTDVWMLSNGCDHLPPQRALGEIVAALREAFPATEFVQSTVADYLAAVRASGAATRQYAGELLGGKLHFILSGVWSARMYLKQKNDEAQTLLADVAEPVIATLHFQYGMPWPSGLLESAWKALLQNHPHDSICGCSVDQVHEDMLPRFRLATDSAGRLLLQGLRTLLPALTEESRSAGSPAIGVFNPLPGRRREVVERMLVLPGEWGTGVEVVDAGGTVVPSRITRTEYVERFWSHDWTDLLSGDRQEEALAPLREKLKDRFRPSLPEGGDHQAFVSLVFEADLPASGHAVYRVRPAEPPAGEPATFVREGDQLDNGLVRVRLHPNGVIDLDDLVTGTRFPGLNLLADSGDTGDEYDYAPVPERRPVTAELMRGKVRVAEDTPIRARLEAAFMLMLPARLAPDRQKREDRLVECPVRVRVTVTRESPLVDIDLRFDNRVEDHRLRVEFPAPVRAEAVVSDGHFQEVSRSTELPDGADWAQPPTGTFPEQDWSLVEDGSAGLAVLNRGLPEVAPLRGENGTLGVALTLLRSVGWLSRDDFDSRRRRNAGPIVPTPGAQCPGEHRFRYAVLPLGGAGGQGRGRSELERISRGWRVPPLSLQGVMEGARDGEAGLVEVQGDVRISAIRRHAERETLVVRLYNPRSAAARATLLFARPVSRAWRTGLLDDRGEELPHEHRSLSVGVEPFAIVTLEIEFA